MRDGLPPSTGRKMREPAMARNAANGVAERFLTLHEFIPAARKKLTDNKWDYMIGGAETETTLKRKRLGVGLFGFPPPGPRGGLEINRFRNPFRPQLRPPADL